MMAMTMMPAKKPSVASQPAEEDPKLRARLAVAFGMISMNETYSMTPAENASDQASRRRLVRLAKNASALPRPVASPAISVRPNAKPSPPGVK